jgi:replicative DNA helicase
MSKLPYTDIPATVQMIGGIYKKPTLLDDEKYSFLEDDFTEPFHRIIFGSIFNLHALGAKEITPQTIEDYLVSKPDFYNIYKINKGREYLRKLEENTQLTAFDYYYNRVKKMTLLRMYHKAGMDLSWLYDIDNILDVKKKQQQEDWLDNTPIEEIAEIIDNKITKIKQRYADNLNTDFAAAGDGADNLIDQLIKTPSVGYPMFGSLINGITHGARLGKFYLRSASTGLGKSRSMIADACTFACDTLYDKTKKEWKNNFTKEPTLFIATEQELDEIQTMMLAFISDVEEEHIIDGKYLEGEYERVKKAAAILKDSPLYVKRLPDFSLQDIENTIKYAIQEYGVKYICHDYIHSSLKILAEVTNKAKVQGLREDNVLFMISTRLKDICVKYDVFIISSTQLNGDLKNAKIFDQTLLRGAKSIADKIDIGMIMIDATQQDKDALKSVISKYGFEVPTIKISIYKNRRSKYKSILLWCKDNRGTCKIEPMFATDYNYELIEVKDLDIIIESDTNEK